MELHQRLGGKAKERAQKTPVSLSGCNKGYPPCWVVRTQGLCRGPTLVKMRENPDSGRSSSRPPVANRLQIAP